MSLGPANPSWFPTPPPRPPKPISAQKIMLGTVIPIAAISVAVVLILTQKPGGSSAAAGRSLAAFNACLRAKVAATTGQRSGPAGLQQAAEACASHLPPGTPVPDFARPQGPSNRDQAYGQCMQAALSNVRQVQGRFDRQSFENASVMCRALSGAGGSSPPVSSATTTPGAPTA